MHASYTNLSCSTPAPVNGSSVIFNSAAIPFTAPGELLKIGRTIESGTVNETTCKVDTATAFSFSDDADPPSPNVIAQFTARDGNVLILDDVMDPTAHPLMKFPTCVRVAGMVEKGALAAVAVLTSPVPLPPLSSVDLLTFVSEDPNLTNFTSLLVASGVVDLLRIAPFFPATLLAYLDSQTNPPTWCVVDEHSDSVDVPANTLRQTSVQLVGGFV